MATAADGTHPTGNAFFLLCFCGTCWIHYRPQWSWAKVMYLQVCVILFTGEVSASVHAGIPNPPPPGSRHTHPPRADTPQEQTPPQSRQPPGADTHPLRADTPPEQTPREQTPPLPEADFDMLLECILVRNCDSDLKSQMRTWHPFCGCFYRHFVSTGPLAIGHLIWPLRHLLWHSSALVLTKFLVLSSKRSKNVVTIFMKF